MSASSIAIPARRSSSVRRSQALSILGTELRRNFITKRGFWIYGLALAPALIVTLHSIVTMQRGNSMRGHDIVKDTEILANLFQVFILRPAVYFGCVGIFTYLFRGEVVERTLHYYFLSPVRREVLVGAKYLAGLITAIFFFCASTGLTFWGMYLHFPDHEVRQFMLDGPGLSHLFSYLGATALACMGWGAVCVWMGIRFRNPIVPSVVFLTWESINLFLPSWLRPISVLHYLQSLTPVAQNFNRGPGAIIGTTVDPVSVPIAILAIFAITAGMLALAVWQLKRSEISYSSD